MSDPVLRSLMDLRGRIQKTRIQFGNRLDAIERGVDPATVLQVDLYGEYHTDLVALETRLDKDIARAVRHFPIYDLLAAQPGIGPMLAAKIIANVDISRSPTVSTLWRYAGYGVKDGQRDRPVKGEKLVYNAQLKTALHLVGNSFLRHSLNSPYRPIYDEAREHYALHRPEWTDAHKHLAALRKTIKLFLSHLWEVWREMDGLPTRRPYAHDRLGHTTYHDPRDFGW